MPAVPFLIMSFKLSGNFCSCNFQEHDFQKRTIISFQKRDGVITCWMVTSNLLDRYALPMITINTCMKQKAILDNIVAYLANIAAILQLSRMAKRLPSVSFSLGNM